MVSPQQSDLDGDRRQFLALGIGVAAFGTVSSDDTDEEGNEESDEEDGASAVHRDWPALGFDAGYTSYNAQTAGPVERVRATWHFGEFTTGPVVADGTVYAGGRGHAADDRVSDGVYALDAATGALRWRSSFEDAWFERPTVANGTVYVFGSEDVLYALDAVTGEERWRYADATNVETPTVADGTVYCGGREKLVALDAETGDERWRYDAPDGIAYPPSIRGGRVFASEGTWRSSDHPRLRAFDAETGGHRWSYELPYDCEFVRTAPTVADETVYVGGGSHDIDDGRGRIVALDAASGERTWTWVGDEPMNQAMALAHDTLFVPVKGSFTALDAGTGDVRWQFAIDPDDRNPTARIDRFSPPAVVGDTVYVAGYDAAIYALDARTGERRWRYAFGDRERASSQPAVVDGTAYVACDHLYALGETGGADVKASYVFRNTGPGPASEIRASKRVSFWAKLSSGPIARYEWDFTGDGSADETGQFANYVYDESGEKTVRLRVVGVDGRTDAMKRTVRVRAENGE